VRVLRTAISDEAKNDIACLSQRSYYDGDNPYKQSPCLILWVITMCILLRIKFSDLNLGILHKLDAGQNVVAEGGRAEAVHGK
jgi:hypothetical protein